MIDNDRIDRPSPFKGLVAGVIGGLGGGLAMVAVQAAWSVAIGPRTRPAEHDTAGDSAPGEGADPSTIRGARASARALGVEIPRRHERAAGHAFHFAFGAGLGGFYGVLVEYIGLARVGAGIPFGILQVPLADELSVPMLGLSGAPSKAPASAHLRSIAAHAAFGLATEMVRRRVRAWF